MCEVHISCAITTIFFLCLAGPARHICNRCTRKSSCDLRPKRKHLREHGNVRKFKVYQCIHKFRKKREYEHVQARELVKSPNSSANAPERKYEVKHTRKNITARKFQISYKVKVVAEPGTVFSLFVDFIPSAVLETKYFESNLKKEITEHFRQNGGSIADVQNACSRFTQQLLLKSII